MGSPDPVSDLTKRAPVSLLAVTPFTGESAVSFLQSQKARNKSVVAAVTSAAAGFTTVAGCIELGENNLNLVPDWHVGGARESKANQTWFIANLPAFRALAHTLPLKGVFSNNADVVNDFLAEEGFSIKLEPLNQDEYGMASTLKLASKWKVAGHETVLTAFDGKDYIAAHLDSVDHGKRVPGHEPPVVILETQDEIRYLVTELDDLSDLDGPGLFTAARALLEGHSAGQYVGCEGLTFPKVNLNVQPDIGYLLGLNTVTQGGQPCVVSQAKQQIKLEMDHLGAKVEEATAMGMQLESCMAPQPPIELKRPFLVAVLVPVDGKHEVALAFRVAPDAWTTASTEAATATSTEDDGEGGGTPE